MLQAVGNAAIFVCAGASLLVVVLHARTKWWTTPVGRVLMGLMFGFAAVFGLLAIRLAFGDTPWFAAVRFVVFVVFVPPALLGVLAIQIHGRWLSRRERRRRR
jgi:hypothetical protein